MAYTYDSSTGNIVDEKDGQIVATTSDRATTDQGALLASSKDLFDALHLILTGGVNQNSTEIAHRALQKAIDTVVVTPGGKHFQHSYRLVFRISPSTPIHSSLEFKANHHDHAKTIIKAKYPDCIIMNIVRL